MLQSRWQSGSGASRGAHPKCHDRASLCHRTASKKGRRHPLIFRNRYLPDQQPAPGRGPSKTSWACKIKSAVACARVLFLSSERPSSRRLAFRATLGTSLLPNLMRQRVWQGGNKKQNGSTGSQDRGIDTNFDRERKATRAHKTNLKDTSGRRKKEMKNRVLCGGKGVDTG
ncbi:hypothetical protein MRX96_056108 [Rhipicephalus microplus]